MEEWGILFDEDAEPIVVCEWDKRRKCDSFYIEINEKLKQENAELRKQYCERTDCAGRIGCSKKVEQLVQENEELKKKVETLELELKNLDPDDLRNKNIELIITHNEIKTWLKKSLKTSERMNNAYSFMVFSAILNMIEEKERD